MRGQRGTGKKVECPEGHPTLTPAPFFCLTRAAWIPYAVTWDPESGEFHSVEGPRGFDTYREGGGGKPVPEPPS